MPGKPVATNFSPAKVTGSQPLASQFVATGKIMSPKLPHGAPSLTRGGANNPLTKIANPTKVV